MTIIARVVAALHAAGHTDIAVELQETIANLGSTFKQLDELNKRKDATVRKLVFTMQSRCKHFEWYLVGPEDVIACFECGHTLCDKAAADFGRRVLRGDYFIHSRAGGRRFGLSPFIKKQLGDKLVVKEMRSADEETLRDHSERDDQSAATVSDG